MEWIGIHSIGVHCIPMQFIPGPAPSRHPPGERNKRVPGRFHYNSGNATNHPEVRTMLNCVACGVITEVRAGAGPVAAVARE